MKILSHRGYWKTAAEKNTPDAFNRSFGLGFGTETDLRDFCGQLVIAHDPPTGTPLAADDMFAIHARHDSTLTLALNVKADGLQDMLKACIARFAPADSFVFDMAVPDALGWLKTGIQVFTRHSDVETEPAFYAEADGVWLDAFRSDDWWDDSALARHRDAGKRVCIVSPELHGRDHRRLWDTLATSDHIEGDTIMLCTDLPQEAGGVFGHED